MAETVTTSTPTQTLPRRFDFRGETASTRGELQLVQSLHDALADTVAAGLKSLLRSEVTVETPVVEVATWDDYVRSLAQVTVLGTVGFEGLDGTAVVELDARFALALVERLLGGPGDLPPLRRPSQLEAALLADLYGPVLDGIAASFLPLVEVAPSLQSLTFDPQFLRAARAPDRVVVLGCVVTVEHEFGMANGMVTICYPATVIEPVLARHPGLEAEAEQPGERPFMDVLEDVESEVVVRLAPSSVAAADLVGLAVGDVLRLDHRLDQPVTGYIGDAAVLVGRAGQRGDRVAIAVEAVRAAAPDLVDAVMERDTGAGP